MRGSTRSNTDFPLAYGVVAGLRNFASSESLPGVCPDRQRQGALDAEDRGVEPYETRPLPRRPGLAGVRAALSTALAADRRDRST
jgi:hypothetical protein